MSLHKDFTTISQITPNIYLSGVPAMENYNTIKELGIKYILCCFDRSYITELHNKILMNIPDTTILYLPYDDNIYQNLWAPNKNQIKLLKYVKNMEDHKNIMEKNKLYQNKPMIEIGYHFIDEVVSSGNKILIHCMAGVSRSVSLVAYYFMKKYNISFNDALKYIRNKRKVANPNESFKNQLMTYHKKRDKFTDSDAKKIISSIKA